MVFVAKIFILRDGQNIFKRNINRYLYLECDT